MKFVSKFLIVFLLLGIMGKAMAQDTGWPLEPVYASNAELRYMQWLPDSSGVILYLVDDVTLERTRLLYSPDTQTTSPYEPTLPPDVLKRLESQPDITLFEGNIWGESRVLSPDGRFVAYLIGLDDDGFEAEMALTDLTSGETTILEDIFISDPNPFETFSIRWAANSRAFTTAFQRRAYYVHIADDDINQVETTRIYVQDGSGEKIDNDLNNKVGWFEIIANLDDTGQFLPAYGYSRTEKKEGLQIVDLKNLTSEFITEEYSVPLLVGPDDAFVNLLNRDGFFQYDRSTKMLRELNLDIAPRDVGGVSFSPDGRFIALIRKDQEGDLYILPLNP